MMKWTSWYSAVTYLCAICAFANALNLNKDGQDEFDQDTKEYEFSWESLFDESMLPDEIFSNQKNLDVTAIQNFLVNFGKSLDHCNLKIEESAQVSKYLIGQYMRNVIGKSDSELTSNDNNIDDISLDDVDFENTIAAIPDEDISDTSSDSDDIWDQLKNVLVTLREACDNLPITIVDTDLRRQQHPETETVLDGILLAMTRWTKKWTTQLQVDAYRFIESCVASQRCENNLKIIMDIISNSLGKSLDIPVFSNQEINLQTVLGSSALWEHMNSATHSPPGSEVKDLNSYLRVKLQKMAGILGHFGGLSHSEDLEYIHSSGVSKSDNNLNSNMHLLNDPQSATQSSTENSDTVSTDDDVRMQRMLGAAVNVLRFPWKVEQPNSGQFPSLSQSYYIYLDACI